jgi:hypothetical protein
MEDLEIREFGDQMAETALSASTRPLSSFEIVLLPRACLDVCMLKLKEIAA